MPWLVVAVLGVAAGDLCAALPWILPLPLLIAVAGIGASLTLASPREVWRRCGLALLLGGLGYAHADTVYRPVFPADHLATEVLPATISVEARLIDDPERLEESSRLALDVIAARTAGEWHPARGRISLTVGALGPAWRAGDRLQASLALRRPRNFGNPGEFDYERHLARRGVYVTGFAADDSRFERLAGDPSWVTRWRASVRRSFDQHLPAADADLLAALILGTARELPREVQKEFRRTGTSHILSISGLHVSLVALGAYAVWRWLLARSEWLLLFTPVPKLATALALVPVGLYASIAGSNVATTRSLLMLLVLLGAALTDRRPRAAVGLAAAGGAILWQWPGSTLDPSCQLSFFAVAGLLVGWERFQPWWQKYEEEWLLGQRGWRGRFARGVALWALTSISATLPTIPLVAYHFNQVSLVAPFANALVVPLLGSAAVGLGMVSALLSPLSEPLAGIAAAAAWPALAAGRLVVHWLSRLPGAAISVVTLSTIELALLYGAMAAAVWMPCHRRQVLAVLALVAMIDVGWAWRQRYWHDDLRATFLSVGQGDCTVIELPGGEVMVVDSGGLHSRSFDVGERVIAPFLWSRRIARIDYLVLSHADWDHYGGMGFLAANFGPREFWWSGRGADTAGFRALRETLRATEVRSVEMRRGESRLLGGVRIETLGPASVGGNSSNDSSVVLSLAYGEGRLLLPGDIEAAAEAELVQAVPAGLASTVLKVPHHGSRTSSTAGFLAAVRPDLAIVSAGFANRYSFPHREVLRRYAECGANTRRTDLDGAVDVQWRPTGGVRFASQRPGLRQGLAGLTLRRGDAKPTDACTPHSNR